MTTPFFVWFLAGCMFAILGGIVVAEVWIRLRDGYGNDPIDLDAADQPKRSVIGAINEGHVEGLAHRCDACGNLWPCQTARLVGYHTP